MSARDLVFASIRSSLGVDGHEAPRRKEVTDRMREHPTGVVPARGHLAPDRRVDLFADMATAAAGSVTRVNAAADVPKAIAKFLRRHNLSPTVRRGEDARLAALPWEREKTLEVTLGPSDGHQLASVSHAFGAVAETGTLVLTSGADNPTTLNFLPDNHIVVLPRKAIEADYESVFAKVRSVYGKGDAPRTLNFITGPSRSADIEQTLLLGAHGPRRLHIVVVG